MYLVPPPEYDHPPSIPVIEHVMTLADVQRYCSAASHRTLPPDRVWRGCTVVNKIDGKCYIVRVDDAAIRRHERAHCNGWKHPQL